MLNIVRPTEIEGEARFRRCRCEESEDFLIRLKTIVLLLLFVYALQVFFRPWAV